VDLFLQIVDDFNTFYERSQRCSLTEDGGDGPRSSRLLNLSQSCIGLRDCQKHTTEVLNMSMDMLLFTELLSKRLI